VPAGCCETSGPGSKIQGMTLLACWTTMSLDPRIFVPVVPVVTGCQQSGYLASRMSVSTTGWSDNHSPTRDEPWVPAGEQLGSSRGAFWGAFWGAYWRMLASVGQCWRVFASVSSAEPADPKPLAPKADRTFQIKYGKKCCKPPTAGTCGGCKSKCPHVSLPF